MKNYPERLQEIIRRDTGITVTLPESIGRGYWRGDGVFGWECQSIDEHKKFVSEDSMGECIRFGVEPKATPPNSWRSEWEISRKTSIIHVRSFIPATGGLYARPRR